ncbi:MAG: UDP-glucuronate decarboxylase [Thermomicrobiales bacterium]|nr:UDP-glucuronate decarboxylase [Thermomicrobiales bacterium]
MRILVTGGAGFVGSHLVDRLLDRGDEVVAADNFLTGSAGNLAHVDGHPRLRLVLVDVSEPLVGPVFSNPFDRVYHLASPASPVGYRRYPIETLLTNSKGTLHSLEIARRDGARYFLASTSEVYGEPLVHPQREDYWGNVNPVGLRACYDEGKRFAESLTMEFHRQHGVDTRIARIFNTYGPRSQPDDGRVVPNFCLQALRGEPITIYGDGSQTRSFCYISDLVDGILAMSDLDGLAGEIINLGNPVEISIREFAETVIALAGSSSALRFEPLPVDDPTRRRPDIAKAQRVLGWDPRVDLRDGLLRTLASFAEALPEARPGRPLRAR